MAGLGLPEPLSLSSCFVLEPPVDSYGGILHTDQQLVQISKRRGGCGIDLGHLRPTDVATHNSSKTSTGMSSWMNRYSNSIREVGQNGRRGALMLTLSVHHPDILTFITIKNDNKSVTGANISVKLTDEFLKAVKSDSEYEQRWPLEGKPQISKMVKAKDIWKAIIHSAWLRAEPGLVFWDNILRESIPDCYDSFKSVSLNPCQPKWAKILTKDGIREFKDIDIGTEIWSTEGWTKVIKKWSTGINKVFKYKFGWNDSTVAGIFYGTENHNIVSKGIKLPIKDTKSCDCYSISNNTGEWIIYSEVPLLEKKYISEEETFDITVDNNSHTYWTQGCNVSNCAELNLSILDSCRLLVLNLMGYVSNPFTSTATFNFEEFYKDCQVAQRLMDDLVDLEIEAIDKIILKIQSDPEPAYIKECELVLWMKIRASAEDGRRTGTGLTALGDCLAALGMRYGSESSIETTDKIYKTLKFGCYRSSIDMAKEIGTFPIWNWDKEKNNPFIDRIFYQDIPQCKGMELVTDMKKYGRRNIGLLTSAPTGTTSMMAGYEVNNKWYYNTTSGIEPCFMDSYTRRKKGNPGDKDFRTDFTDQSGDTWMEFQVRHSGLEAWLDINKSDNSSPYTKSCASDIDWVNRVKLQAAAQEHIDHSISSTINLPNDVTEEKVAEIYETAWKLGLKGVTVYRDGCRSGVLIKKQVGIPTHDAPLRPKEIECDVYHISVQGKPYFVLIGLFEGCPYEVFAGRNGFIDKKVKKGKIIRIRTSFYKAILEDETEISPITLGCSDHEESLTRMTSLALRHGADIKYVMNQLSKVEGDMNSYAKSVARALKKYIPDGSKSGENCPECSNHLIFQEGCLKCSCGFSKCG